VRDLTAGKLTPKLSDRITDVRGRQYPTLKRPTNGAELMRYVVRLVNATVCDIRFHMPNNKNPDLVRLSEYEDVAFAYQKI
jgi:type VI protein secretion system component Hcp